MQLWNVSLDGFPFSFPFFCFNCQTMHVYLNSGWNLALVLLKPLKLNESPIKCVHAFHAKCFLVSHTQMRMNCEQVCNAQWFLGVLIGTAMWSENTISVNKVNVRIWNSKLWWGGFSIGHLSKQRKLKHVYANVIFSVPFFVHTHVIQFHLSKMWIINKWIASFGTPRVFRRSVMGSFVDFESIVLLMDTDFSTVTIFTSRPKPGLSRSTTRFRKKLVTSKLN